MEYVKMDPELKQRWLTALRSGEYEQGHEYLARLDRGEEKPAFCCLGVLCAAEGFQHTIVGDGDEPQYMRYFDFTFPITNAVENDIDEELKNDYTSEYWDKKVTGTDYLPVRLFDGLDYNVQRELAEMNDNGKTFAQIADWIEENL